MADKGGFDYLDNVSGDAGSRPTQNSNLQTKQDGLEPSPADGGEGYIGGNSNAGPVGFDFVTGKKGSSTSKPVWSQQTPMEHESETDDGAPPLAASASDSTDENADYKDVQTDEGLPQTYRTSKGAGDAGPSGSDEPDSDATYGRLGGKGGSSYDTDINAQAPGSSDDGDHSMNDMPTTEFTGREGGGAPLWKHKG
jgi:hypothetical protein